MEKVITFPLHLTESFSDSIGKSAKKNPEITSKHEYIINAIKEKQERDEKQ